MDGQRQYPADSDRWFADHPDDDAGRVPGQRGAERYADPDAGRYPDQHSRGVPATYGEPPAYGEPKPYGEPEYRREEPPFADSEFATGEPARRRRTARPVRVGKRSGLELPDATYTETAYPETAYPDTSYPEPGYAEPAYEESGAAEDSTRYRAERLDRQALRRDPQPSFDPSGLPPAGVYPQVPAAPSAGATQAPTQSLPSTGGAPAAVYTSKRPGIALMIALVAAVAELALLPVLAGGEFAHGTNPAGVLGALFALIGVPMVGIGLYALACGAATAGSDFVRTWSRPPLAYLPVGLILLIVAGLAA